MANFNDDTKKELNQYFGEGVHKVKILAVDQGKTDDGKEYFEFKLEGENGEDGNARIYWTEKAQQFSFNTVRGIFVHNTIEKNKDAIRKEVDATTNTDELFKLCQALKGKEAWYVVQKTDRTYTNSDGETKFSYNRNLYGYEYVIKKTAAQDIMGDGTPVDASEVPFE